MFREAQRIEGEASVPAQEMQAVGATGWPPLRATARVNKLTQSSIQDLTLGESI